MKNNKANKRIPVAYKKAYPFLLLIATLFMGVGYAAVNSISGEVSGTAIAQANTGVFITTVTYGGDRNAVTENCKVNASPKTTLSSSIELSSEDDLSYYSYNVNIKNNTTDRYAYVRPEHDNSFYNDEAGKYNSNIIYEVLGISEHQILEPSHDVDLQIRFKYNSPTITQNTLNSYINFVFKKAYTVTYIGIDDSKYPAFAVEGEDLVIDMSDASSTPSIIKVGDEVIDDYTYKDKILTIPNVNGDVSIEARKYVEILLNGADPVLSNNLVPILLSDNGAVTKADIYSEWYKYGDKRWANAVVLKNENIIYNNGDTIPESNIESYFVWIPKYSYQLWDLGTYTSVGTFTSKEQAISIRFGTTDTSDNNTGECTTPGVAGLSGNCAVGEYMTHPAFRAFNSNGFWVGKFETGYDGATASWGAESNTVDTSKIVIKPNVYAWRNLSIGNAFKNSYDYLRNQDSHMMKNTEWGAVAYLQHSIYGSQSSVRINNNTDFITGYGATEEPTQGFNNGINIAGNRMEATALNSDGTYTKRYNTSYGYLASTTGNITGVYDMSGGAWEYVMGYTTGASTTGGSSAITSIYGDFFTNSNWNKYYDRYSATSETNYNNRILGDATGEMGPLGYETDPDSASRYKLSWYRDQGYFLSSSLPWFYRGGCRDHGSLAGIFAFRYETGGLLSYVSFRVVLTP